MSTTEGLSNEALDELAKYDTPTVCNVIELWNIRPRNVGFMNDTIKACFPKMPPMVGYALTSTFRSMAPPRSGDVYAGLDNQVAAFESLPGAPVVVYQDMDEPTASATFGEVMCSTYKAYGAKGIITSGAGRDLDQVEALDFPRLRTERSVLTVTVTRWRSTCRLPWVAFRFIPATCCTAI